MATRWQRIGDGSDLATCRSCGQPFVVPTSLLDMVGEDRYVVELGCNNCGWRATELHDDDALEELDRALDGSTALMRLALETIEIGEELVRIDRFAAALHDDHILPEDF